MKSSFDTSWTEWINTNLTQGCCQNELKQILLESGFEPTLVENYPGWTDKRHIDTAPHTGPSNKEITRSFQSSDVIILPGAKRITPDKFKVPDSESKPKIKLYYLDNFVSEEDCQEIIRHVKTNMKSSTITTPDETDKKFRTSQTCHMGYLQIDCLQRLNHRICEYMGMESERSEDIQGQHYEVGQEFKAHTDFFTPGTTEYQQYAGEQGQRTWTFMIYLNDVPDGSGGDTEFVRLGMSFQPKRGQAIIWNNLLPDGSPNQDTLHWAHKILQGDKTIITKWFRQYGKLKTPFIPRIDKLIVPFSQSGFTVVDYTVNKLHSLSDDVLQLISNWFKVKLGPVHYYNVNIDSMEKVDGPIRTDYTTEVFSAVINLDSTLDVVVSICDFLGNGVELRIHPNQILIYESSKIPIKYQSGGDVMVIHTIPLGWERIANVFTKSLERGFSRQHADE